MNTGDHFLRREHIFCKEIATWEDTGFEEKDASDEHELRRFEKMSLEAMRRLAGAFVTTRISNTNDTCPHKLRIIIKKNSMRKNEIICPFLHRELNKASPRR